MTCYSPIVMAICDRDGSSGEVVMPDLAHNSKEYWDGFLGLASISESCSSPIDEYLSLALTRVLLWHEAGQPDDKVNLIMSGQRTLESCAHFTNELSIFTRDPLGLLHERLPLIIDEALRCYCKEANLKEVVVAADLKTPLGVGLLKARDSMVSPGWKALMITAEYRNGKVFMRFNIDHKALLDRPEKKAQEIMSPYRAKTLWEHIDGKWRDFVWDAWYPFTGRFLGVAKAFELREYEFAAAQKYLEIYIARLIHHFEDVSVPESERSVHGLLRCIELANKHLARIRFKPELVLEDLTEHIGLILDKSLKRFVEQYRSAMFNTYDLGKQSAVVRRIMYYSHELQGMKWSDLYLKATIKDGIVVITLDKDGLDFVCCQEHEFNKR